MQKVHYIIINLKISIEIEIQLFEKLRNTQKRYLGQKNEKLVES